jgi:UDP-glucose 4-epimerase
MTIIEYNSVLRRNIMARFLVTGGCGFIGSHLVQLLQKNGHSVKVLDDLSTGKKENINSDAVFIEGTVTDATTVQNAMKEIDGCFHLAAIASVQQSVEEWQHTHAVNLTGTINVFEYARKKYHGRPLPVLYVSSAAVYGDNPHMPLEEKSCTHPLSAYGADKLGCELHANVASEVHQIPTIGFRLFNIYGPRQDPSSPYSGVISIFADKLKKHLPITIFGDGQQCRDFVYVSDVVDLFSKAMDKMQSGDKTNLGVFNICRGKSVTIKELAETMASVTEQSLELKFAPARAGDIKISCGNPSNIEKMFQMIPTTELRDGLAITMREI